MANAITYTQEDKVRAISPQDLARILILALGDTNFSGIRLLAKKSDGTFEEVKTDDAGALSVNAGTISVDVAAIKAKTDNLPDSPANEVTSQAIQTQTDKIAALQQEVEWSSTPVSQQVASAAATNLTAGSITPTFPTGSTRVRALLVASIHASNQAANTHHISLKVQGQKAAAGYGDLIDLTAQTTMGLVNLEGATDSWVGSVDVTTLVDASAAQYDFRFQVDSDNAGAVNYTTLFLLVLVYKI